MNPYSSIHVYDTTNIVLQETTHPMPSGQRLERDSWVLHAGWLRPLTEYWETTGFYLTWYSSTHTTSIIYYISSIVGQSVSEVYIYSLYSRDIPNKSLLPRTELDKGEKSLYNFNILFYCFIVQILL